MNKQQNAKPKPKGSRQKTRGLTAPMAPMLNRTSRRATFNRRMTDSRTLSMVALSPQLVSITHREVVEIGAASITDWWDEFRITRVQLVITGVGWKTSISDNMIIHGAPTLNATIPTNANEMNRMTQLSRLVTSKYNLTARTLVDLKNPTFDVTGSQDHYMSDWLVCAEATLDTPWVGCVLMVDFPLSLTVDVVVDISYRGFQ